MRTINVKEQVPDDCKECKFSYRLAENKKTVEAISCHIFKTWLNNNSPCRQCLDATVKEEVCKKCGCIIRKNLDDESCWCEIDIKSKGGVQ